MRKQLFTGQKLKKRNKSVLEIMDLSKIPAYWHEFIIYSMKRNDVETVNEDERVIVHSFEKVLLYPAIPVLYTVSPKSYSFFYSQDEW